MWCSEPGRSRRPVPDIGEVHIWRVALDLAPVEFGALEAILAHEERLRASNFGTERLRRRWATARGALRAILAAYAGISPRSVALATDGNGKPQLAGDQVVAFNLSHTEHLALVAVAAEGSLGIDAEIIRPDIDWEAIGRQFFADAEFNQIASLAPERRVPAFFACWTRKEAYLKAIGLGLNAPLDKFEVTVRPDETPRLVCLEGSPDESRQWSFHDLSEPGMAAALAVKSSKKIVIQRFSFSMPPREK
jgi:4'-phosphopantetheinyl transferase